MVPTLRDFAEQALGPLAVVSERFDLLAESRGVRLASKQVQGRLLTWAEDADLEVLWQRPQERLNITRPVLVRLEMWLPGHANRHIMDAVRHGVVYLQRLVHLPTLAKGWPPKGASDPGLL